MAVEWKYGIVAFLDVLGFASFVETDASTPSPQHLERLLSCLSEVRESIPPGGLDLRSFSDSIILSGVMSLDSVAEIVTAVVKLQRIFARRNVLVRGAIAYGKHFIDQDSVYSEALVRAYKLERDHARFPRVLLDLDLLDWFIHDTGCTPELQAQISQYLLRDRDGHVFLHYLDSTLLGQHSQLLKDYETKDVTASVLEKWQWLAAYHNYIAQGSNPNLCVAGPLVVRFRSF
jgi:hypothetical protein